MSFIQRFFKERRYKTAAAVLFWGTLAVLCACLLLPFHLFNSQTVVLAGNTPDVLKLAGEHKSAQPKRTMHVVIGLKLRNQAELESLLQDQQDPASLQFRAWLTADQFTERFGPTKQDADFVSNYFQGQGLNVVSVSPNRLLVEAEGTVEVLEKIFNVKIGEYDVKGIAGLADGVYLSNDRDPTIPAKLASVIESVSGLSEVARFHPGTQPTAGANTTPANPGTPTGFTPKDIAVAYNFPNALNANAVSKYSGKGRTIAVATAYSYKLSDVYLFWYYNNITRGGKLVDVNIGGSTSQTHVETTLDLQTVSAQAPDADIMMYKGVDPLLSTFTKVFNTIVTDNKADVVTVSWGLCENSTGIAQMKTEQAIFQQGAAQGMAFFASSGDDGAYDCKTEKQPIYAVDYPSSDPYVTAVGGTSLWLDTDGSRSVEKAWKGSGGGVSPRWNRPWWQTGPGVPAWSNRMTADVSIVADPNTGYAFLYDGKWVQLGGTSVSAPDWAALWVLAVEAAGKRLGLPDPTLYRLARSIQYANTFFDVVSGDNGNGRGPGYWAKVGWDQPTGLGTPNGVPLVNWIAQDACPSKP